MNTEALVIHLFHEAEHDAARLDMLMALRDFVGLGHNLGGYQSDDDIDWDAAVREALDEGQQPPQPVATEPKKIVCIHCGAEVFWGLPRPEDPCFECGKPVGENLHTLLTAAYTYLDRYVEVDAALVDGFDIPAWIGAADKLGVRPR